MPIPPKQLANAEVLLNKYFSKPIPAHARGKVQYGYLIRGTTITLFTQTLDAHSKTQWHTSHVARIRFNISSGKWLVYWQRGNLKWVRYPEIKATSRFEDVLKEIDTDPFGAFWG
jgi:hypothetical protein